MFEAPKKAAALMRGFEASWIIAGGWAIDLFLERETRPHADVEIAVFRRDQLALQARFSGLTIKKAVGGALVDWPRGEYLEPPVHEIHLFDPGAETPVAEVLLNETDGENWLYRRNAAVTKPLGEICRASRAGIPYLCPEIALLYKSKAPRERDEADLTAALPRLDEAGRRWLARALAVGDENHPWLERLG